MGSLSRKRAWGLAWLLAILWPICLEFAGLLLPGDHDVLTHWVQPFVRSNPIIFWITFAAYQFFVTWLGWHWWFEEKK